jgi:hypothetical protein
MPAILIAGCGASPEAKSAALQAQIELQLSHTAVPAGVTQCVSRRASGLAYHQLQALTGAGGAVSASDRATIDRLLKRFAH